MKRKKKKKTCLVIDGFKVLILKLQWKEHECRHYSSFSSCWRNFYKLESLAGENIILLYLFGKKKNNNNNKITSSCLSNFKGPIVSYFSAALSCEQRPFFLVTRLLSQILLSFVIVTSESSNKSKVESGKPAKTRASQGRNPIGIGEKG